MVKEKESLEGHEKRKWLAEIDQTSVRCGRLLVYFVPRYIYPSPRVSVLTMSTHTRFTDVYSRGAVFFTNEFSLGLRMRK